MKIALAEDKAVYRNAFSQKINSLPGITLVFTAGNGGEFLKTLNAISHNDLPQIAFMDIEMPEMDGIKTIQIAKALYPQIDFIVLTVFDDDIKIFEAIKAGASGYLLKHEPAHVIKEAIENIMSKGGAPMSPAIARKALMLLSQSDIPLSTENNRPQKEQEIITAREKEVLQMMVNGWDAKRIAVAMDISTLTVRKHIANIYTKLHVNSKAQVISIAHKNKWT